MKQKILYLLLSIPVCMSNAAILHVSKSGFGTYTEVQPAIDAASPGDTILVAPSEATYAGFTLDLGVHIIGAGTDTIQGRSTTIAGFIDVQSTADGAELNGLLVRFARSHTIEIGGYLLVLFPNAIGVRVVNCAIENSVGSTNNYCGCVYLSSGVNVVFESCLMWLSTARSSNANKVIRLDNDGTAQFHSCVISSGYTGMFGGSSLTSVIMRHCLVVDANYRQIESSATISVENCAILGSLGGVIPPNTTFAYCASNLILPGLANLQIYDTAFNSLVSNFPRQSDFHLSPNSLLIDAGNPISPPDRDASRADIGIYGGQTPYDEFGIPDYPFVIELEIPASVPQNGVLNIGSTGRVGNGGGQ